MILETGNMTHAHCFNCKYRAQIDKFDYRRKVIANDDGMELLQIVIICPICKDEHCEGLFQHEIN